MAKKKLTGPKVAPIKLNGTEVFEHGQDDYSAMHLENSIYPTNLTEKGVKYAEEVGKHAAKAGKKNIISSTVQRAEQTADIISSMGKGLQHYDTPILNTWNIGVYNGAPEGSFNEVEWARNPNAAPEGGESFNQFASRMQDAYKFANEAPKDDQLIAHSKVTRALEALNATKGKWTNKTTEKFLDAKEENKVKNGGWLDKYNDGGPVQENNNDFSMSAPEGWVGSGTFNKGRDYSPAWGGQFAEGGELEGDKYVDPEHTDIHRKIDVGIDALKNAIYSNPIVSGQLNLLSKGYDLLETGVSQFYKNQTPEQKEKLFQKYRPIDYPNFISGLARNIQPNVKPRMDDKGNYAIEEEAWRKAMELPVKSNYIRESKYKPTSAKDPNAKYYTFHPNVIDSQKLIDYANSDAWEKNKKISKNGKEYLQMSSFAPFMKQDFIDRQSLEENQKVSDIDPLQRFQIFKGYDPKKKKNYISISDTYDFDFKPIKEVTKPYDIYDRFYYENGGSLPGAVGFVYARTNDPAPSNGPYAKKTKASAENGTEMRFYQEGLDWKPKTISKDGSQLVKLDQLTNFTNYNTKQPGGWLDKYEG